MKWCWRKCVVYEKHLVGRVADKIEENADNEHFNDTTTGNDSIRACVRVTGAMPQVLSVELSDSNKEIFANDYVANNLHKKRYKVKQHRFGIFEYQEHANVIIGEHKSAVSDVRIGVVEARDDVEEHRRCSQYCRQ